MAYVIVIGNCFACGRLFGFNPYYVPSIRVNGERQPVCRDCVIKANPLRLDNGLPEIQPHPEAYEPVEQ